MEKVFKRRKGILKVLFGICICLSLCMLEKTSTQAYEASNSFLYVGGTYMVRYGELQITTVKGEQGTATYNEAANTLTLNNFKTAYDDPIAAQNMSGLRIVLNGINEFKAKYGGISIHQKGSMTICGNGTLNMVSGTKENYGVAISTEGNLSIQDCILNVVSSSNPLVCDKDIVIKNSKITLKRTGVDELNDPECKDKDIYNRKFRFAGLNAESLTMSNSSLDVTGINYAIGTDNKPVLDADMTVTDENGVGLNLIKLCWPEIFEPYPDTTMFEYVYSKSGKEMIHSFDDAVNRVIIKNKPKAVNPSAPSSPGKPGTSQSPADTGKVTGKYKSGNLCYSGKLASGKLSCVGMVNKKAAAVSIPSTVKIKGYTCKVTAIGKKAFKGCTSLRTVKIGNNVTSIGAEAFCNCTRLKTLTFGKNVKSISDKAFYKCTSLEKVSLPSKTGTIKAAAFVNCTSLKTVKTGNGVSGIGSQAFSNCKKLSSLSLGKNVSTISDKAFYKCSRLTKVTFPSKVKYIKKNAFASCTRLKSITLQGKSLKSVGSAAFRNTGNKIRVNVPKSKYSSYKKILKGKGLRNPVYKIE